MSEVLDFIPQYKKVFSKTPQLSDIEPADWGEKKIVIPGGKGRLNYDFNPYCRKVINTLSPNHPARIIAVQKGSQITFSSGVIMPALGYTIEQNPRNTLYAVGKPTLVKLAVEKLDYMIMHAKLQDYIKYSVQKKRNTKSGDTDELKTFINGFIKTMCITDLEGIAQMDLDQIFLDDLDMMKGKDKKAGSLIDLVQQRAASNKNTYKLMLIGTPLVTETSNIIPAFNNGDRELYFVECPCCHKPIIFKWSVAEGEVINPLKDDVALVQGGLQWATNNHRQIIKSKVGYICYKCGEFFTDKNKQAMIRGAYWDPTAVPISDDYYSFKISSLYAPVGMFDWAHYCGKFIEAEANPETGRPRNEYKMQVLVNTCQGEGYSPPKASPKATQIMRNKRNYEIGTVPDVMSESDGNGRIVLLTMAADCNGTKAGVNKATVDDARIDWEIVAWSERGPSYSIAHGSIGTFIPSEGPDKQDRERLSYHHGVANSVWPLLDKIQRQWYKGESGLYYGINKPCIDYGYVTEDVAAFMDWTIAQYPGNPTIGVRGNKDEEYIPFLNNISLFEPGKHRNDVYYIRGGMFKDMLSEWMLSEWKEGGGPQPPNFMNYPYSANGLYEYSNFFEHYEAEERQPIDTPSGKRMMRWVKKNSTVQNHMLDCRIYNMAEREIIVKALGKELGMKEFTWTDYAKHVTG